MSFSIFGLQHSSEENSNPDSLLGEKRPLPLKTTRHWQHAK